jgi:hypothetical protein
MRMTLYMVSGYINQQDEEKQKIKKTMGYLLPSKFMFLFLFNTVT